jgi:ParB-like chromosome segregation protein Spo0J
MKQNGASRISVPIGELRWNPKNPNVVPPDVLAKLRANIKRNDGLYPPVIVRPLPDGTYVMLDGHHRKMVLEQLGHTHVNCEVWDISEQEADIALATLNRLHGEDDKRLRAELLASLMQTLPTSALADMLPESVSDLEKLAQPELPNDVDADAPQPLIFKLYPEQYVKVRNALEAMKTASDLHASKNADGQALYFICVEYLSGVGWEEAEAARMENEPPIGGSK